MPKTADPYRPHRHVARGHATRERPTPRSRASTRSLIDPVSSPFSSPGSPHTEELWHYRGAFFRPVSTLASTPRTTTATHNASQDRDTTPHARPSLSRKPRQKRGCFSAIQDRQIKHKLIGLLISGALLVLLLTIYLSLAVSGSVGSSDFHVVMIVFTLVLTMIFCHFIIRLCMLCFRFRARVLRRERERSCTMDEGADEDYAQPETPIPVILARDEELGLHDDASADSDSVRPVQHPPPAYGLWISSVRANPDLIHWQRNDGSLLRQCEGETPDLAQHPAMRPPTYHSREPLQEAEAASSVYSASPLPMLQPVAYRW
ncbi:MAG: hypothetical protein LQ345_006323 [Seirophora villosa]|nr:MAG: hypothetical protein LQ345_006323 [Seirophora villosa]